MSCSYSLENLLALLHKRAPTKADAVSVHRRQTEHGLLSVGLKIHCVGDAGQFSGLIDGLGGAQKILEINSYRHARSSMCLVLPPIGSARSAILLLESIELFVGIELFNNKEIQLQICSPGRLDSRRSAMLAIGFYLGSDTLRRYDFGDLETSFTAHFNYPRGRRLVLYDADGDFDRDFEWWKGFGPHRIVDRQLPFSSGRSDLLAGHASRLDIENVNLLATLLVHSQFQGYWGQLGKRFEKELESLLQRHLLAGLLDAPWVRTADPESHGDQVFFMALQELVAYAFEEAARIRVKKPGRLLATWKELPARSSQGILREVRSLMNKYRGELLSQARVFDRGERA